MRKYHFPERMCEDENKPKKQMCFIRGRREEDALEWVFTGKKTTFIMVPFITSVIEDMESGMKITQWKKVSSLKPED